VNSVEIMALPLSIVKRKILVNDPVKGFGFLAVILTLLFLFSSPAFAKNFYISPTKGSVNGDGSFNNPWPSIDFLFERDLVQTQVWQSFPANKKGNKLIPINEDAPIKGGDTVYLMGGMYGNLHLEGLHNKSAVTFKAYKKHTPIFNAIFVLSASNWVFDGVTIVRSKMEPKGRLFAAQSHGWKGPASNISLINSYLTSAINVRDWSVENWRNNISDGIYSSAGQSVYKNNIIKNIGFGIQILEDDVLVDRNIVDRFTGDGMRALGDYGVFQNNLIKNSVGTASGNHDDGIQSWSRKGKPVVGVVIRNNTIINFDDPALKFAAPLQGIGLFDGFFHDWVIENNVIMVDHWHGISVLGFKNLKIMNNTVVDLNIKKPGPPWILVDNHKDGRKSSGGLVRNNLSTGLKLKTSGVRSDHNFTKSNIRPFFKDYFNYDLRLKSSAPVIDAGSSEGTPKFDRDGKPRGPDLYDIGAYEYIK